MNANRSLLVRLIALLVLVSVSYASYIWYSKRLLRAEQNRVVSIVKAIPDETATVYESYT